MSQEINYKLLLDITLQPCSWKNYGKRGVVREAVNEKHFTISRVCLWFPLVNTALNINCSVKDVFRKKAVVIVNVTVLSVLLPTFFTTKNAIIRSFILVYCYFKFQVSLIEIWFFPLIIWYLPLDGLIKPVFLLFSTLLITSLIETKQRV